MQCTSAICIISGNKRNRKPQVNFNRGVVPVITVFWRTLFACCYCAAVQCVWPTEDHRFNLAKLQRPSFARVRRNMLSRRRGTKYPVSRGNQGPWNQIKHILSPALYFLLQDSFTLKIRLKVTLNALISVFWSYTYGRKYRKQISVNYAEYI